MRKGPVVTMIAVTTAGCAANEQRWLGADERLATDGAVTDFALPHPMSSPTTIAIAPDGTVWFTESNGNRIGRMRPDGSDLTEFDVPTNESAPRIIALGADGALWFIELNGTMDGRVVNGNRVGRITLTGQIAEFPIPSPTGSPTNVAVGPDRNVWYTKGAALGRVTPDGVITEFPLAPNARGVGLTAGSDRQPPERITNRLWYADGNGNKIGYLHFR
jgi:virginiamycin B lyase